MSVILFAVLTILGAYVVTVALALGLLFLAYNTAPSWMSRSGEPRSLFLLVNILIWSFSAALGGMLVGWLAQWHPNIVAFGFACAVFAVILSVAVRSIGKTTLNYEVAVAACAAACAIGGSLLMQLFHLHLRFTS
jgi:hypothetical protein